MSATPEALAEARRMVLQAEAAGNSALPDGTPSATPAAPKSASAAARELQDQPQISPADQARADIAAKFAARRGQNLDTSEAGMHEGVTRMLANAEGEPIADPGAQPVATVPQPAATRPAAPAPNSSAPPLANQPEMVTVTVDGRQVAVPAAEVWRAGLAATQKMGAADVRLERAAMAERQIALDRAALDARAAEIERTRAATPTGVAPAPTSGTLPTGAQPTPGVTKKALDALLEGDVDGAASALDQVVTETVEARLRAAPAATPATRTAAAPAGETPSPWSQRDIDHANTLFVRAYPDVAYNPQVMAQAMQRMQHEMANPVNRLGHVDLVELADRIGQQFKPLASVAVPPAPHVPPQPPASNVDELAARRALAARVPAVPTSAAARSVGPAPSGPAPPSRGDIVNQMRRARGQPVN